MDLRATSSVIPFTRLSKDQQYQQSRLHLYSTNKYDVIGWKSPGSTRDLTYGSSQPRIARKIGCNPIFGFPAVPGPGQDRSICQDIAETLAAEGRGLWSPL